MAPIDGIRFVHAAILEEARDFEAIANDAITPEEAGSMLLRLEFYAEVIDGHMHGEELGLFPPLVHLQPNFADTYLHDHDTERELIANIVALAHECAAGDYKALGRIRRETVALMHAAEMHVEKENTLVIPLCRELFTPEEQADMVATMLSSFSPNVMSKAAGWIVSTVDLDTGADYLAELGAVLPPAAFAATIEAVRATVGDHYWDELVAHAPALGGPHWEPD